METAVQTRNKLLRHLSAKDFARLRPHLEAIDLPLRKQLESRHRKIEFVYFIDEGMASMVVAGDSNRAVEIGMVGFEGMTGLTVLMATASSPHETFMQGAGSGWRMAAEDFGQLLDDNIALRHFFLRYAHTLQIQMCFTALANARYRVEERLARWLLMANDRFGGTHIKLTHEFLSIMLGTRRPGVTEALNKLERRLIIKSERGSIIVTSRKGLEDAANGCYGVPEIELAKFFEGN